MNVIYIYTNNANEIVGVSEKPVLYFDFPVQVHEYTGEPPVPYQVYDFINGAPVLNEGRAVSMKKQSKVAEIGAAFTEAMNALVAGYPEREISSWPQQEKEARAYLADNTVATPLLDALSTARGVDKTTLAQKIVEKADAYAAAAGTLIGKRQALEDQVNTAMTVDEVNAVVWS